MAPRQPLVSDAELEVLRALWDRGSATLRETTESLRAKGRRWARTTVQTLLHRLLRKGYVSREKADYVHVYYPAILRDEILTRGLRDLAERFCGGTASPLARALVRSGRFSDEEIEELRTLLDQLEKERAKRATKRSRGRGR